MEVFAAYFGELFVGLILMVFGFTFQNSARAMRAQNDRILSKLEGLVIEFHNHRVDIENRVTRVETKVDIDMLDRHEARLRAEGVHHG